MHIAITGSSGRIGRAIHHLLAPHHQLRTLDRRPAPTTGIVAELDDAEALNRLLEGADALVHVAALHAPHVGREDDAAFERVNVRGTAGLLEACVRHGVPRVVLTSTTALYGHAVPGRGPAAWLDEAVPPQPRTIYHRSKLRAEALLRSAARPGGGLHSAVALRMSRCFPEPADQMATYRLHRGIDARDVASAHRWAVEHAAPGWRCHVVSGATPFSRDDLDALGHDAPAVLLHRAPALVRAFQQRGWALPTRIDRVYAADALIAAGWTPVHGFEEVLRQFDQASPEVLPPRPE